MVITRKQWDAIASFSIAMHSVFYTEKNSTNGVLTVDRIKSNGILSALFETGLTKDSIKQYLEYAVKKGGGTEFESNLSNFIPDLKKILERFDEIF